MPRFYKENNMKEYDYLIVGAGLSAARSHIWRARLAKAALSSTKRPHTGGNIYCEDEDGIHVHKYGAIHLPYQNREVWRFVNSLAEFNRYTNSPIANYRGGSTICRST